MWFLAERGRLWFHTPDRPSPFLAAARAGRDVAVLVAVFDPPDVRQVRATGPARLADRADERVHRLYRRYVRTWTPEWEAQALSAGYRLWSMTPERGMAVAYPDLADGLVFRWTQLPEFLAD